MEQHIGHHPHHEIHTYEAPAGGAALEPLPVDDEPIRPRKRSMEGAEMDMTPMIDITFLLLIFFLVASKISVQGDVSLPMAKHGRAVEMNKAVVLIVRETGSEGKPEIFLGDSTEAKNRLKATDPDDQDEEIASFVEDTMLKEQKTFVVIKASRGIKAREVSRIAEAVGRAETVQALHVAVLEKP